MPTVTPFLMFEANAEEAVDFYVSIFPDARVLSRSPLIFELQGQRFNAFNGGPHFRFSEAISLSVSCADQAEIDRYWSALTANGGEESQCGWLKDRWGLSWQIVPEAMGRWMSDPQAAPRVVAAFMPMKKLDIAALERAAAG
jgi:predicted 3-demethylubiquinone-9 3-methyltransferase (glyoxalase superfamily)